MDVMQDEYKNSTEINEFGNFIFLLYKYNPVLNKVSLHVDGNKARFILTKDEFYTFIKNSCNENIAMRLRESLSYWDVYFLFNRKENTNKMISIKKEKLIKRPSKEDYMAKETSKKDPFYSLVGQFNSVMNKYYKPTK